MHVQPPKKEDRLEDHYYIMQKITAKQKEISLPNLAIENLLERKVKTELMYEQHNLRQKSTAKQKEILTKLGNREYARKQSQNRIDV
jgi:hypothetical protein